MNDRNSSFDGNASRPPQCERTGQPPSDTLSASASVFVPFLPRSLPAKPSGDTKLSGVHAKPPSAATLASEASAVEAKEPPAHAGYKEYAFSTSGESLSRSAKIFIPAAPTDLGSEEHIKVSTTAHPFEDQKSPLRASVSAFIPGRSSLESVASNQLQSRFKKPLLEKQMCPTAPVFHPRTTRSDGAIPPASHQLHGLSANLVADAGMSSSNGAPLCRFYLKGACQKGLGCPFLHDTARAAINVSSAGKNEYGLPSPYPVDDGISCDFGEGALVKELILGDSEGLGHRKGCTVVVSNLSLDVSDYDIERRLSSHGSLCHISVRRSADGDTQYATATFTDATAAKEASKALHGTSVEAWMSKVYQSGQKRNSMQCISVIVKQSGTPSGAAIKVQWYAPSRAAWAHFNQRWEAEKVARKCNGKELNGRVVSVKFQEPTKYQHTLFTAWISNLAETVTKSILACFVQKYARCKVISIDQGDLPFSESQGPAIVKKLLNHHGQLVSFNPSPNAPKDLKRRALARFSDTKEAEIAVKHFNQTSRVAELGGTKLFVQRVFNLKYTLPSNILDMLYSPIEKVLAETGAVRYSIFDNGNTKSLSITGDDAVSISSVKANLVPILKSDTIRDPNASRALWDRYVGSFQFTADMEEIAGADARGIWCDRRRQEIRVFGITDSKRKALTEMVISRCDEVATQVHAVPITKETFEYILQNGRSVLDKLKRMSGCRNASLDLKHKSLLVEGTPLNAKRAISCVLRISSKETNQIDPNALCPVCFCPPDEDGTDDTGGIHLSCKHAYCRECFQAWLTGGNTCEFPIVCLAEGCNQHVSLADLSSHLTTQSLATLLRLSVDNYVRRHHDEFQFCVSPTCTGIYQIVKARRSSVCSTCSTSICNECGINHEDMTCKEYKLASQPPDHLRMVVIDDILTLRCPQCKAAFIDFDGCFALSCSVCPCKFCGWCLKDCGSGDAHPHVAKCPHKEPGADLYFGSQSMFQTAQNKRRKEKLVDFLSKLSLEDRRTTLESIDQDLNDLELVVR